MTKIKWRRSVLVSLAVAGCGGAAGGPTVTGDAGWVEAGYDGGGADAGEALDAGPADAGADAGPADAGDKWSTYAQGFFASYCTSCHTVGASGDPTSATGFDFTEYAQVQSNGSTIRCGVATAQDPSWGCSSFPPAAQFPICNSGCTNPMPRAAERARLVAWVSAGMPQ